jgi:DNA adenine methylase
MKTPISYYGGKQTLSSIILGLIPEHRIYCEPFLGGAAVFFAKQPSRVEIINDTNGELINFYEVLKNDFPALEKEVAISLHSRRQFAHAKVIYENPEMFDRVKRAWAVWMMANSSYGCMLDSTFGYDRTGGTSKKLQNKREAFTIDYAIRLQQTRTERRDALKIIRSRDWRMRSSTSTLPMSGQNGNTTTAIPRRTSTTCWDCWRPLRGSFS